MNFRPMLNPLTILIYILIMFVISTDCSWEFDNDDDFWGAPQPHSHGNINLDYSGIFNTENTGASSSSRPPDSTGQSKTLSENYTQKQMEATFWEMYKKNSEWKFIHCNDKEVFHNACYDAWNVSSTTYHCAGEPSYCNRDINIELPGREFLLRVDLLQCKCVPHNAGREEYMSTRFRYLARYNDSTVFILMNTGPVRSRKVQIIGMVDVQTF